jgi:Low molecular weight phosphotyrosine protein phosphatase
MGLSTMFKISRRPILLGLAVMLVTGAGASSVPRVLFICQAGTAKSAIAREFFRRRARERGITVSAFSRGLAIEDHVSLPLRNALRKEGINPAQDRVHRLVKRDLRDADIVVFFNPLPPSLGVTKARDWTALPSVNDNWPAARADLMKRIDALLDEIAGTPR